MPEVLLYHTNYQWAWAIHKDYLTPAIYKLLSPHMIEIRLNRRRDSELFFYHPLKAQSVIELHKQKLEMLGFQTREE